MKRKLALIWFVSISFLFANSLQCAPKQRVAVIGGGGSGLTTTWLLDADYDVTLFEAQNRLGGHANSIEVDIAGNLIPIEAGFEFICESQFPHFYNLLKNILKVALHEYTLTSTFYRTDNTEVLILPPLHDGKLEWQSLLPHAAFTMMEFDHILNAGKPLIQTQNVGITLENFMDSLLVTDQFKNEFFYPFLAAGWGVSKEDIKQFAAYDALKYVVEGKEAKHYQWIEIVGGTQKYIQALAAQLVNAKIKLSTSIVSLTYHDNVYTIVETDGTHSEFDHLVVATNANQASELLKNIPEALNIHTILSQIEYFKTTIAIHGDPRFMPAESKDWSVVNVRYDGINSATTAYKGWLSPTSPIFKSWLTYDVCSSEDKGSPLPDPLYALVYYEHPKANLKYFQTQKAIGMVQGDRNLWFAGNYTHDNDSHESAIMSAVNIAKQLAPQSQRLAQISAISGD